MDVNKAEAVAPAGQSGRKPKHQKDPEGGSPDDGEDEHPGHDGGDAVTVDGVLAGGVTPEVQALLNKLTAEIEPLRAALQQAQGQETHFREQAGRHSFLPIPNRHEFMRELAHVLSHIGDLSTAPALVALHVGAGDAIRRRAGRTVLDGALAQVCTRLMSTLHATDVIGSLGGNDLGIILLTNGESVADKVAGLSAAAAEGGFAWQGSQFDLDVKAGFSVMSDGETPDHALEKADRSLLGS